MSDDYDEEMNEEEKRDEEEADLNSVVSKHFESLTNMAYRFRHLAIIARDLEYDSVRARYYLLDFICSNILKTLNGAGNNWFEENWSWRIAEKGRKESVKKIMLSVEPRDTSTVVFNEFPRIHLDKAKDNKNLPTMR